MLLQPRQCRGTFDIASNLFAKASQSDRLQEKTESISLASEGFSLLVTFNSLLVRGLVKFLKNCLFDLRFEIGEFSVNFVLQKCHTSLFVFSCGSAVTFHEGTQKPTHPNETTICTNDFRTVCTNRPLFSLSLLLSKKPKKQTERVCANCLCKL